MKGMWWEECIGEGNVLMLEGVYEGSVYIIGIHR